MAVLSGGCSSGPTNTSSFSLVNAQGSHPANFLSTHPGFVGSAASECRQCHGDNLTGGIANISCFTASCHHGTVPGWATPAVHGALAKGAPDGSSGFNACQICHASNFTGDGSQVSCLNNPAGQSCHGSGAGPFPPHPAAPWTRSGGSETTHTDTVPQNASVCALCHLGGGSVVVTPPTPPPAGSNPGCFNNTLCHDQRNAPHAIDTAWLDPAVGGANFHGLTAKQDLAFCQTCHGTPGTTQFDGGAVPTSCSASTCHPAAKAHPIPWFEAPQPFPSYVASHRDSGNRDVACAICHKVDGPGAGPDPAAPSCFTNSRNGTSCHANGPGNAPHPTDQFLDHPSVTQATFTDPYPAGCSACHAVSGTSPLSAAPTCTTCHGEGWTGSIAGTSPLTNLNCTSCHDGPSTGPTGTTYPNAAGGHSGHVNLDSAGTPVDCDTCHTGLGSGSTGHYDRANARTGKDALRVPPGDTAFGATYIAKSAALPFINTDLTCEGISCHGGQTTPNWQTGTIDVDFDSGPGVTPASGCRQCHVLGTAQGVPEHNSPYSGLHQTHLEQISSSTGGNALCTECHDMANGTTGANNHFRFLSTLDLLEGPASDTVTFPGLSGATYNAGSQNCTLTCHGTNHDNFSWTGGSNHAIPFLDPRHTTMNAINFPGDCGVCHSVSPASPSSSPPTCQTCHQADSPLIATSCNSCHASPPDSVPTAAYPNVEGGHTEHDALGGVTGNCSACHTGLLNGSLAHYNRANARTGQNALRVPPGDVSIPSTYFAKPSGAVASFTTAFTCSNVSCHGGILTPRWDTGTINVNFDSGPGVTPASGCRQCHTLGTAFGTPQNNSAWSGLHQKHLQGISGRPGGNALCTECHDMTLPTTGAQNHFTYLDTAVMEGPAGQTVRPDDKSAAVPAGTYTVSTKTCTGTCHTQSHSGWLWEGPAASHALGSAWADPTVGGSSFHGTQAKQDLPSCQTCHGTPGTTGFGGGSAVTSCAASGCHPNARAHPTDWQGERTIGTATITHRSATDPSNLAGQCALCHKVDAAGSGPLAGAPSCFSASFTNANGQNRGCHSGGPGSANHPVPPDPNLETSHLQATQTTFTADCSSCHSDTGTSPVSTAPNCVTCHTNFASSNPLTTKNCTSCHGDPPTGTTTYPNIEGGHAEHNALTGVTGVCSACHNGLDPGNGASAQQAHYAGAKSKTSPGDAAFLSTYNAKSGAASFNSTALTCANVSCHGGLPAPNWRTGTINVNSNTGCLACHALGTAQGTPENNSPYSGLHSSHLGSTISALCTECHDMANGTAGASNHFTSLNTPQMEGPANQTVTFPGLSGATYNAGSQNCTVTCHGTSHTDFSWSGGTSHSVPYLNTAHTGVSSGTFSSTCSACHFETGSTTKSGPTCTVCHQSGSPLTSANCSSCHADPPAGSTYPNIAGTHAGHNALTGVTNVCTTCHNGLDTGSQAHYDRANARPGMDALRVAPGDAAFLSTYNAKSGAASFNSTALTCANVSCHGGLPAPNWQTGTINVNSNAGCLACHTLGTAQGTPENNSLFSGRHAKHLTGLGSNGNAVCTECHDMANGTAGASNHFTSLNTPQMEGNAGLTIEPLGAAANYNASNQSCTVTCHTQSHSGWRWEGSAANHSLGSAWIDPAPGFHGLSAKSDLTDCQSCHSQSGTIAFDGGSATTSCAGCHPDARAHPIPWNQAPQTGFPPYTASHRNSGNQAVACAVCHKVDGPGAGPDAGAPSCFSDTFNGVTCHSGGPGGANHSVPNLDTSHFQASNFGNCSSCHSDTGTSPVSTAPNCVSCHTNFASSNPLTTKNCTSCHADPPTGTGTTPYPNIERAHSEHNALPEVTGVCSACHDGLDPGTGASAQLAHYTRAKSKTSPGDVAILATYNAKNATASFGSMSCSNVSCHGGQTINWDTGSINVNTDAGCNQCHRRRSQSDQWNSPFSGEHGREPHVNAGCTACHNTTKLANPAEGAHFLNLSTTAMEVRGSVTIGGGTTDVTTYSPGSTVGNGSCSPRSGAGCHGTENW
ncbi:MAG: hypothetical protein OEM47_02240 [Deltaproteobacteria bacterium]|nr:hypothetical protein [Deltaproteobacteria bacterium]